MPAPVRLLTRVGWPGDVAKTSQSSRNLWLPSLVDFAVLGALAVQRDSEDLPLGGPKQRALLAILLLNANTAVSRDRLIDGIWGERPPPTAAHTLDNYISRLRKTIGDGRVSRRAPGYVLEVMPDELDLDRFERLLALGREHLAAGRRRASRARLPGRAGTVARTRSR